ncbi:MAG TPA: winged helix-turn-helix domain-containing protein [Solirubrobacteraceae bacterium]|nr:winged helix-turn-helix domain-containing protein [Solirubrobacteraceae bacterium]
MQNALQTGEQGFVVGPLQILPDEHLVRARGRVLMLSTRELRLLTELARHEDHIVSREDLFTLVWERPMRSRDRSVDVYVRKLRVKLEAALPEWRFIHTHFGFGYRLTAERVVDTDSQLDNSAA